MIKALGSTNIILELKTGFRNLFIALEVLLLRFQIPVFKDPDAVNSMHRKLLVVDTARVLFPKVKLAFNFLLVLFKIMTIVFPYFFLIANFSNIVLIKHIFPKFSWQTKKSFNLLMITIFGVGMINWIDSRKNSENCKKK